MSPSPVPVAFGIVSKKTFKKNERKNSFLVEFSKHGSRVAAAKSVGMGQKELDRWLETDDWFREHYNEHLQALAEKLEGRAYQRALAEAKDDPQSATLLMFLLKAMRPEVYREKVNIAQNNTLVMQKMVIEGGGDV